MLTGLTLQYLDVDVTHFFDDFLVGIPVFGADNRSVILSPRWFP